MAADIRIGDAAADLGVDPHVLRHWEDMGLLRPPRSSSGHRTYDDELLTRARLIQVCQRAGMSLAEIRELGTAGRKRRVALVAAKRTAIRDVVQRLRRADAFLAHQLECRHPMLSECEQCSGFAAEQNSAGRTMAKADRLISR